MSNTQYFITIAIACIGWALTVIGFVINGQRNSKKDIKESASETQAVMTRLDFLTTGMGKIESKLDTMSTYTQAKLGEHEQRLTKLEVKWEMGNEGARESQRD